MSLVCFDKIGWYGDVKEKSEVESEEGSRHPVSPTVKIGAASPTQGTRPVDMRN